MLLKLMRYSTRNNRLGIHADNRQQKTKKKKSLERALFLRSGIQRQKGAPPRPPLTLRCSLLQRANMACLQRREDAPDSRRRPVAVLSTSSCASPSVQLTLTHVALPVCCQQSAPLIPAFWGGGGEGGGGQRRV